MGDSLYKKLGKPCSARLTMALGGASLHLQAVDLVCTAFLFALAVAAERAPPVAQPAGGVRLSEWLGLSTVVLQRRGISVRLIARIAFPKHPSSSIC